jgi:hypothetical protein
MKTILITTLILFNIYFVQSQNLVVGYSNPNEILNINSGSFNYDTVFVINNATLNISNQTEFIVNDIIALLGTSKLNVENSYFEVNNIFFTQNSSSANLKDSLNLACNFYFADYSTLNIDSAAVNIPMTYKGEFIWYGFNNSTFEISNSVCNLNNGSLGGNFDDSATFSQFNNQFVSSILPMTLSLNGNSTTSIDSCSGGMEFVIAQNANVDIQRSNFFMIWYVFDAGDTVNYEYPPQNSIVVPGSSHIIGSYQFSDALPNVSGVELNVSIQNSDVIFWGIISKTQSNVIINNSSLLACGFYFEGTTSNLATGMLNAQLYSSYNSPFSDRIFSINNTSVGAWNFYPTDTSEIIIKNCIYGESLGFGNGITKIYNSTCDGTGGYLGGMQNSEIYVYSSEIIRQSGTAQIINFQNDAKAWIYNSNIVGDIVISNNVQLFLGNTTFTSNPTINQNSYFAEAWVDSLNNASINSLINITGKVYNINGALNNLKINRYTVEYSLPDSTGFIVIKDTTATNFNILNGHLTNWNTQSLTSGNYLLWLTIFVDGDTTISCNREVVLTNITGINEPTVSDNIYLYPNPTTGIFTIKGDNILRIKIFNTVGKEIYNGHSTTINLEYYQKGIYIVSIKTENGVFIKKILLD